MARLSKAEKQVEKDVETAFYKHSNGVQISVMDLGKITKAGKEAAKNGTSIEEAVKEAIAKYRCN